MPILLTVLIFGAIQPLKAQGDRVVVRPQDNGSALINPGMGWVFHHYDNDTTHYTVSLKPSDAVPEFSGVSVVYMRLAWSYIEPQEGHFNWSILDTAMQKWTQAGKQVAFRFTMLEGVGEAGGYATPRWVQSAGAKGLRPVNGMPAQTGSVWEPYFNDPIFLEKLDHFLAAVAAHYDGNPRVAFIDVGFGLWGEGHTVSSSNLPYDAETIRQIIDLYKKHFKKTLLVANDDFALQGRGLETLGYARDQGLGLRDDSVLVEPGENAYHHAYLSYDFWPRVPIIIESQHYGVSKETGAWGDGHLFLQAVEDYHASYVTVHWYPREFLEANRELVHNISMRLGYRLELQEISWPTRTVAGTAITVGYRWANAGVAPCLPGGYPTLTFEDQEGGIAGVFVDRDFDMRELPVGAPGKAKSIERRSLMGLSQENKPEITFNLPPRNILKPGNYSVFISVGDISGTPAIALPLKDDDGHRRYRVGTILIEN